MNRNKEKIQYFSTEDDGTLIKIIVSAVVFHLIVVVVLYGLHCIDMSKPVKEIPVFELVQIDEPVKQQSVVETPREAEAQMKDETSPEEQKQQEVPPEEPADVPPEPVVENPPPPELPPETPPEQVPETVPTTEPVVEPTPEKAVAPDAPKVPNEAPAPDMKPDTPEPVPVPKTEPSPEETKKPEEVKPEKVKPVEKPKPEEKKKPAKKPVEKKKEPEKPVEKTKVKDDFDIDDLDLQKSFELPSLRTVNPIDMDPLMQVFLERAKAKIMSNFNPPNGLSIPRDAKTTVQFSVERSGQITSVLLKRSSSNTTWDHLSVRAVKISKLPELPPTYRGSSLVLQFNFTPN
ncbi:MAG: TonB C-terminal domain-containing protein [Fibrobacter sp.]|nr:TonB C-terminal domain-containing protein [Fibrobacter sp.]